MYYRIYSVKEATTRGVSSSPKGVTVPTIAGTGDILAIQLIRVSNINNPSAVRWKNRQCSV